MAQDKLDAKEKRSQERFSKVEAGLSELEVWLQDLMRVGILSLPEREKSFFTSIRARMIDAQARGLGDLLRDLSQLEYNKGNLWQQQALEIIAKMYLLIEAFKRFDDLDILTQQDLKIAIGWNVNQKEVVENPDNEPIKDDWLLFHRSSELIEDITVQKNWFYGCNNGKFALVLYFSFRNLPIEHQLEWTKIANAELIFAPSALPIRAFIKSHELFQDDYDFQPRPLPDFDALQETFATQMSQLAWLDEMPYLIAQATPLNIDNQYFIKDNKQNILPISKNIPPLVWLRFLAISGGRPISIFILKNSDGIIPLGVLDKKRFVSFHI